MTLADLHGRLSRERLGGMLPYLILYNVSESPEPMVSLAQLVDSSWQNTNCHVDRLKKRGLVTRQNDGEKVMVGITKEGKDLLGRVAAP